MTTPRERLTPKEVQVATLVWEGLTNREIGKIIGTSEQVIKNHLRSTFDSWACGARWNWLYMWPATAGRIGRRNRSGRVYLTIMRWGRTKGEQQPTTGATGQHRGDMLRNGRFAAISGVAFHCLDCGSAGGCACF